MCVCVYLWRSKKTILLSPLIAPSCAFQGLNSVHQAWAIITYLTDLLPVWHSCGCSLEMFSASRKKTAVTSHFHWLVLGSAMPDTQSCLLPAPLPQTSILPGAKGSADCLGWPHFVWWSGPSSYTTKRLWLSPRHPPSHVPTTAIESLLECLAWFTQPPFCPPGLSRSRATHAPQCTLGQGRPLDPDCLECAGCFWTCSQLSTSG